MGNSTNYVNNQTVVQAGWLNDVNNVTYNLLGDGSGNAPTTATEIKNNLGITGGSSGQNAIQMQDEGSNLGISGGTSVINFTGAGVTASYAGTTLTVNVPSGGGVTTFNSRSGAVTLTSGDVTTALTFTPANTVSPTFTGVPLAPTATLGDNTTKIATTAFVQAAVTASTTGVSSFNTRTGAVVPTTGDYTVSQVTGAAPLASPTFTGVPAAPTAAGGTNTTQLATTAFVTSAVAAVGAIYANVVTFGADPTGSADSTTAIQNAINSLNSTGGVVFFPKGHYKVTSTINVLHDDITLMGEGKNASRLTTTTSLNPVVSFNTSPVSTVISRVGMQSMGIVSTGTVAGSVGIYSAQVNTLKLTDVYLNGQDTGIQQEGGASQFISRYDNVQIVSNTNCITVGGAGYLVQDLSISNSIVGFSSSAAILLQHVSGFYFYNIDMLQSAVGLTTYPAAGKAVEFGFVDTVLADTSTDTGFKIITNAGSVGDISFVNTWTSSSTNDGVLIDQGSGTITGLAFSQHRSINNQKRGILYNSGTKVTFTGCQVMSNSQTGSGTYDGMYVAAAISNWSVTGGVFGSGSILGTNNQNYGINIAAGAGDYINITGCNLVGNVTGALNNNSTGTHNQISNNTGVSAGTGGVTSFNTRTGAVTLTNTDVKTVLASPGGNVDVGSTVRSTSLNTPASGKGVEIAYDTGGDVGYIISYDRTASAYKSLNMNVAALSVNVAAGNAFSVATTQIVSFTASPTVPTVSGSDNSTKVASTAMVQAAIAANPSSFATTSYVNARVPNIKSGLTSVSTNGSGQWSLAHGAGTTPASAVISAAAVSGNVQVSQYSIDGTNIYGYAYTANGTVLASSSLYVNWIVTY